MTATTLLRTGLLVLLIALCGLSSARDVWTDAPAAALDPADLPAEPPRAMFASSGCSPGLFPVCASVSGYTQNFGSDPRCPPPTQTNMYCFYIHVDGSGSTTLPDTNGRFTVSPPPASCTFSSGFSCSRSSSGFYLAIADTPCTDATGTTLTMWGAYTAHATLYCNH